MSHPCPFEYGCMRRTYARRRRAFADDGEAPVFQRQRDDDDGVLSNCIVCNTNHATYVVYLDESNEGYESLIQSVPLHQSVNLTV